MGDEKRESVFVYGTLRKGASNHWRMERAEFVASGTVRGRLYTIDWYPGLVLDADGDEVAGEVYVVSRELLAALDEFEGGEYARVQVTVRRADGPEMEAWIYDYRADVSGLIPRRPADWLLAEE